MKLSMWMIERSLAKSLLRSDIVDGEATIEGIRILTDDLEVMSPKYVYIGKGSTVFSDPHFGDSVIAVHGHDVLIVNSTSLETVMNELLSAFDTYNRWEASLWTVSVQENAIQKMVDLTQNLLYGPMAVLDKSAHFLGVTKSSSRQYYGEEWDYISSQKTADQTRTSAKIFDLKGNLLPDWTPEAQIYQMDNAICIGARVELQGESVAEIYVRQYDQKLTQGDVQIVEIFRNILCSLASSLSMTPEIQTGSMIASALLAGKKLDSVGVGILKECFVENEALILMALRSSTSNVNVVRQNSLITNINTTGLSRITFIYGDDVVCIIPSSKLDLFTMRMKGYINFEHYLIGISLPFSSWEKIPTRYNQALRAISKNTEKNGIFLFRDYALDQIIEAVSIFNSTADVTHPALESLAEYDRVHNTDLRETLKVYLACERNMSLAAEILKVHRNTMKYRLKRILEITRVNLDKYDERVYLQISFELD